MVPERGQSADFHFERDLTRQHSVQATKLIHEHYGVIMTFVCSRAPLRVVRKKFLGEWKYLDRALFELPEERATRALIEVALYLRMVDDDEGRVISKLRDGISFGEVVRLDDSREPVKPGTGRTTPKRSYRVVARS